MKTRQTDWKAVEKDYRAGALPLREIGRRHGTSHTAVRLRAKAAGWKREEGNVTSTRAREARGGLPDFSEVQREAKADEPEQGSEDRPAKDADKGSVEVARTEQAKAEAAAERHRAQLHHFQEMIAGMEQRLDQIKGRQVELAQQIPDMLAQVLLGNTERKDLNTLRMESGENKFLLANLPHAIALIREKEAAARGETSRFAALAEQWKHWPAFEKLAHRHISSGQAPESTEEDRSLRYAANLAGAMHQVNDLMHALANYDLECRTRRGPFVFELKPPATVE
ncbi:hypothetical protein [Desulfurivibrio sp. C05AmB]|uniref:hypothetical protein n=1 Tax=Desulfurivibrio sp. C05AmB TaxID=3374371 RepID=UPI00376EB986